MYPLDVTRFATRLGQAAAAEFFALGVHLFQRGGFIDLGDLGDLGTGAVYRNYWAGAEVLMTWRILPLHSDALSTQAVPWLLLAFAIIGLVRELGAREPFASCLALLVVSTPTVRKQVATGYVEVAGVTFLVSGMALTAQFLRRPASGTLLLASAALGLAAGVKTPFFLTSVVVLALLVVRTLGGSRNVTPVWVLSAVITFAVSVVPWLWYASQSTGAPLPTGPVQLLGFEIGRATPEIQEYFLDPFLRSR
jgi:hypothetical protein